MSVQLVNLDLLISERFSLLGILFEVLMLMDNCGCNLGMLMRAITLNTLLSRDVVRASNMRLLNSFSMLYLLIYSSLGTLRALLRSTNEMSEV